MPTFKLTWTIDAEGTDALDAARRVATDYFQARIAQGHPDTACVFQLTDHEGQAVTIDLSAHRIHLECAHAAECERLRKETAVLLGNIAELEVRCDAALAKFEQSFGPLPDWAIARNWDYSLVAAAPAQGQQVEWRTTAVMLEQANAGLAQLNGKLRAELSALKAQQVGQEPAGEVHLRTGGGISLLHVELAQSLPPGTKLYTAPQPAPAQDVAGLLEWAVDRWHAEVANRPLQNRLRRTLDDTWRQVILKLGGDTGLLCGPAHDALAAHDKQSGEKKS